MSHPINEDELKNEDNTKKGEDLKTRKILEAWNNVGKLNTTPLNLFAPTLFGPTTFRT